MKDDLQLFVTLARWNERIGSHVGAWEPENFHLEPGSFLKKRAVSL